MGDPREWSLQRTNSTGIFSASRRAWVPGRELRQGMCLAQRRSMTCGPSRGGRETKSGSIGNSKSAKLEGWAEGSELVFGTGSDDLFMQIQGATLRKKLAEFFRLWVKAIDYQQTFEVLKVLQETVRPRMFEGVELQGNLLPGAIKSQTNPYEHRRDVTGRGCGLGRQR